MVAKPIGRPTTSHPAWRRYFMLVFALTSAGLVLAGFTRTFFIPLIQQTFAAPWFVYVHGAFFFTWVALFIAQAGLVASRRVAVHRRLGQVAVPLIPLMALSGLTVAFWSTARDFRAGHDASVIAFFFGELADIAMFVMFAVSAIALRRQSEWHKRLIVLATLAVLGAAIGRIPVVGALANYITPGLLITLIAFDFASRGRPHVMSLLGSAAFVILTFTEDLIGATNGWQFLGTTLIGLVPYGSPPA